MNVLKRYFKNLPIQRKISFAILVTCSTALAVAALAISLAHLITFRRSFTRDLQATGAIIANNSTAALTFNDRKSAAEILSALRAKSAITSAWLEKGDGKPFAAFSEPPKEVTTEPRPDGLSFAGPYLLLNQPVMLAGERIGTLHLVSAYTQGFRRSMRWYVASLGGVLLASILLALALSHRLQRLIAGPILGLAATARQVAEGSDYSLRAEKVATDEVGRLTDSFNEMLARIEKNAAELLAANQNLQAEIQERVRTQQEVERLHKDLMLASRQAGMAEVATGVLHNVGNVLNSVNVSVNLLHEQLQRSSVGNLAKAASLLEAHRADLSAFLEQDPKGRRLPEFIGRLATLLEEEKLGFQRETEALLKNVEHAKEIVAMQQSYSKIAGVVEDLQASEIVEDAIKMNAGALLRHGVVLERQYQPAPSVRVDRHKVLQVLINLIRNAKYALDAAGKEKKILSLGVNSNGNGMVQVTVRDNGVGISGENLTRIFGLGFTTRGDGHGFGLHSGALAAREMGGSLQASSDGVGTGATFILELPMAAPAPN